MTISKEDLHRVAGNTDAQDVEQLKHLVEAIEDHLRDDILRLCHEITEKITVTVIDVANTQSKHKGFLLSTVLPIVTSQYTSSLMATAIKVAMVYSGNSTAVREVLAGLAVEAAHNDIKSKLRTLDELV